MKAQWSPPSPIESLYKQLSDGKDFAAETGEEISDSQLVRYGYDNIVATWLLSTDCGKWRKMKTPDKTWKKCKVFVTAAVKDYSKHATTAH